MYGKIQSITKASGTISYSYDASGNRISKTVNSKETCYIRDATGNVMSIYEKTTATNLIQSELHLYGSSRIGINNVNRDMALANSGNTTFERGKKFFELSNHLGNVLVTISDKKIAIDNNSDGVIDYYQADVVSANDYYPFGMLQPGRSYSVAGGYRYGFNGQEKSGDIEENFYEAKFWEYDSRTGRRWNVDPKPKVWESPYSCFSGNPILRNDPNGDTDSTKTNSTANSEPPKRGIIFKYGGTNFKPIAGNVTSFHHSESAYHNMNLGLGIIPTNMGLGDKTGTIDEPAAIAELGWAFRPKNGGQWQVGIQWNHLKPDAVRGVYLDNGYTQLGGFVGIDQQLNTNSKIVNTVSINTTLSVGAMFSKPRVVDGVQGNVQGYTRDGKYSAVGIGATLSVTPTLKITNWLSVFGSISIHTSSTKPLVIENGNQPGPGRINTVAGSTMLGGKVTIPL
jgi:YD repeat-containing protein